MAHFNNHTPIYMQLHALFKKAIVTGILKPGERMKTVREIAVEYQVNPNTVQRALSQLEVDGLAHSEGTSGRFITTDTQRIASFREDAALQTLENFIQEMKTFGFTLQNVQRLINDRWEDKQ